MRKEGQLNINHFFVCLYEIGVREVFICPGSRNAPLINAAVNFGKFSLHSVIDERCAGYMALGASIISKKPSVIISTSGTAALNFFPAIAEAKHAQVPLIVLTADRPEYLHDRWENQAIDQKKVFGNYVNTFIEWKGRMELNRAIGKVERMVAKIREYLHFPDPGPVHINFSFSEPLYFNDALTFNEPFSIKHSDKLKRQGRSFEQLAPMQAKSVLILAGMGQRNEKVWQEISDLQKQGAVVLAEMLSGYKDLSISHQWELALNNLSAEQWEKLKPQTLITTGRQILNKNLKNLIRKSPPSVHIHLADCNQVRDTFFTKPLVAHNLNQAVTINSQTDFAEKWSLVTKVFEQNYHKAISETKSFTEIKVLHDFIQNIPDDALLHVANSMPIRYLAVTGSNNNAVYSNRGVSGIDGTVSTAIGAALACPQKQHYLICGDLSFFYDNNALWLFAQCTNLKILLLNNGGGNIFSMIPGPSQSKAKDFFITPHNYSAKQLAQMHQIAHWFADNQQDFNEKLKQFCSVNNNVIFEIKTKPSENKELWNQLKM